MKTAAEWSNDFFRGKKFETIAELVREVREEMAEEAARVAQHSLFVDGSNGTIEGQIAAAIRQLKETP